MLCEIAISRAVSIASSHSCAKAAVVDPSENPDFGSSNVICLSCYKSYQHEVSIG